MTVCVRKQKIFMVVDLCHFRFGSDYDSRPGILACETTILVPVSKSILGLKFRARNRSHCLKVFAFRGDNAKTFRFCSFGFSCFGGKT